MTKKSKLVPFSTRSMRQDLLDEMRLMRVRQHRTMESILNDVVETGVRVLKKREIRERQASRA